MILPIGSGVDSNRDITGRREHMRGEVGHRGQSLLIVPRARDGDIVDAMLAARIRHPSEGRGIMASKGARQHQVKLSKSAVEEGSIGVLGLVTSATANMPGSERANTSICVKQEYKVALPGKTAGEACPPRVPGGMIFTRVGSMCNNDSEPEAGGSNTHYKQARVSMNGNKVGKPETKVATVNASIRRLGVNPKFAAEGAAATP